MCMSYEPLENSSTSTHFLSLARASSKLGGSLTVLPSSEFGYQALKCITQTQMCCYISLLKPFPLVYKVHPSLGHLLIWDLLHWGPTSFFRKSIVMSQILNRGANKSIMLNRAKSHVDWWAEWNSRLTSYHFYNTIRKTPVWILNKITGTISEKEIYAYATLWNKFMLMLSSRKKGLTYIFMSLTFLCLDDKK